MAEYDWLVVIEIHKRLGKKAENVERKKKKEEEEERKKAQKKPVGEMLA